MILDLLHTCVVFFVRFLHNRNVLLIKSWGSCAGEKGLCFVFEITRKRNWRKINNFRIYMCMIILSYGL